MFRFKSIRIKNFGPYKDVTLQFPEEKGVTIIWGNNGQGKTTVLNSFKFLLFNTYPPLGNNPICKLINKESVKAGDQTLLVSSIIEFENNTFELTRKAELRPDILSPISDNDYQVSFHIRNLTENNRVLSDKERSHLIEMMLPESVSRFFLFDAELLEQYKDIVISTSSNQSQRIKESIEKILGLPVLTNGRTHVDAKRDSYLTTLKRQNTNNLQDQQTRANIEKIEGEIQSIQVTLNDDRLKKDSFSERHSELEDKLRHFEDTRLTLDRKKQLDSEIAKLGQEKDTKIKQISELSGSCWKYLVQPRIESKLNEINERIKVLDDKKRQSHSTTTVVELISESLRNKKCKICGCDNPSEDYLKTLLRSTVDDLTQEEEAEYNSLIALREKLKGVGNSNEVYRIMDYERDVTDIESKLVALRNKKEEAETKLSITNVSETELMPLVDEYDKIGAMIRNLSNSISEQESSIAERQANLDKLYKQLNKSNPDNKLQAKVNLLNDLSSLLKDAIGDFRQRLKEKVEQTAEEIFLDIRNQPDFDGLKINDSFGLQITSNGEVVDMRSSGYEEVVAVSLIGSLHKNSPLDAPVFMDSFFGKLDPEHKRKVVKELMKITNQAILFVYQKEIDSNQTREDLQDCYLKEFRIMQVEGRAFNALIVPGDFDHE